MAEEVKVKGLLVMTKQIFKDSRKAMKGHDSAFIVWQVLYMHANYYDGGNCFPSHDTIMDITGIKHLQQLRRDLQFLADGQFITITKTKECSYDYQISPAYISHKSSSQRIQAIKEEDEKGLAFNPRKLSGEE